MVQPDSKTIADSYRYIEQSEYAKAFHLLDGLVKKGVKSSQVYWGLLLATHQCKSDIDLFGAGVPITNDDYYRLAYNWGSAEEKERYSELARLVLLTTQLYIYTYTVENKDAYLAQKWIGHYKSVVSNDDPSCTIHQVLLDHCRANTPEPPFYGALIAFYTYFERSVAEFKKTGKTSLFIEAADKILQIADQYIRAKFKAAMDVLYAQIAEPIDEIDPAPKTDNQQYNPLLRSLQLFESYNKQFKRELQKSGLGFAIQNPGNTMIASAEIWTSPCAAYTEATGQTVVMVNLDNCGTTAADRWITLAEKLWRGPHAYDVFVYNTIASFYANAEKAGADINKVRASRDKMIDDILDHGNLSFEDVKFLLGFREKDPQLNWRYVTDKTENFTRTLRYSYPSSASSRHLFEEKSVEELTAGELEMKIGTLKKTLNNLPNEKNTLVEDLQPYVDRAIANGLDYGKEYEKKWQAYLTFLENTLTTAEQKILNEIEDCKERCRKLHRRADRMKIVLRVCIILFLCAIVLGCILSSL